MVWFNKNVLFVLPLEIYDTISQEDCCFISTGEKCSIKLFLDLEYLCLPLDFHLKCIQMKFNIIGNEIIQ